MYLSIYLSIFLSLSLYIYIYIYGAGHLDADVVHGAVASGFDGGRYLRRVVKGRLPGCRFVLVFNGDHSFWGEYPLKLPLYSL